MEFTNAEVEKHGTKSKESILTNVYGSFLKEDLDELFIEVLRSGDKFNIEVETEVTENEDGEEVVKGKTLLIHSETGKTFTYNFEKETKRKIEQRVIYNYYKDSVFAAIDLYFQDEDSEDVEDSEEVKSEENNKDDVDSNKSTGIKVFKPTVNTDNTENDTEKDEDESEIVNDSNDDDIIDDIDETIQDESDSSDIKVLDEEDVEISRDLRIEVNKAFDDSCLTEDKDKKQVFKIK